jgi:L-ascorbate metabolism protein UlaG (beta-lactamase superfamily)
VRVTWIGHSTLLIEDRGIRALTDPVVRNRVGLLRRIGTVEPASIGGVDVVLISHAHRDHLDVPSLRLIGSKPLVVVPRGVARVVRKAGLTKVIEAAAGESLSVGGLDVKATYARHRVTRNLVGATTSALGYVVSGSQRLYFAGDTGLFPRMRDLAGDLDVAVLPIAGWGSRVPADHLDPQRAALALTLLRPRVAIPIHWGTLRRVGFAREEAKAWKPVELFVRRAAELAPDVRVLVPTAGMGVELSPSPSSPMAWSG